MGIVATSVGQQVLDAVGGALAPAVGQIVEVLVIVASAAVGLAIAWGAVSVTVHSVRQGGLGDPREASAAQKRRWAEDGDSHFFEP